jgi:hypothetical protein
MQQFLSNYYDPLPGWSKCLAFAQAVVVPKHQGDYDADQKKTIKSAYFALDESDRSKVINLPSRTSAAEFKTLTSSLCRRYRSFDASVVATTTALLVSADCTQAVDYSRLVEAIIFLLFLRCKADKENKKAEIPYRSLYRAILEEYNIIVQRVFCAWDLRRSIQHFALYALNVRRLTYWHRSLKRKNLRRAAVESLPVGHVGISFRQDQEFVPLRVRQPAPPVARNPVHHNFVEDTSGQATIRRRIDHAGEYSDTSNNKVTIYTFCTFWGSFSYNLCSDSFWLVSTGSCK